MLAVTRIFAVALCAASIASCDHLTEAMLLGIWRSEDDEQVDELACRKDHGFTTWSDRKNELTTPSVLISVGGWQLRGNELVVHFTKSVDVDSWSKEDKLVSFAIVKLRGDMLLMKNFDGSKVFTYHRISPDCVLVPMTRSPIDADFIGTWRIHYNTRDFEMTFSQDHTFGDFAKLQGVREQFFAGTWYTDGNHVIIDAKSLPTFDGERARKSHQEWLVTGIERQRVVIKDGPVPYCLERLK